MLYLVSTPIGNLKDITLRAIEVLKDVDIIACEDTRRTGKLLHNHDIVYKKMTSYHDHNRVVRSRQIIEIIRSGGTAALVSDGGTPNISDPGFYLINRCIEEGIKVVPVPGPSAVIAAVSASGLPTDRFSFYGFLPKKDKKKSELFNDVIIRNETSVFYESPHRIQKTLSMLTRIMPERRICLARELTKKHEEFIRGTAAEVQKTAGVLKGEIVLMIGV